MLLDFHLLHAIMVRINVETCRRVVAQIQFSYRKELRIKISNTTLMIV